MENKIPDKTYYIFGDVDKEVEQFRTKINNILYKKDRLRNIKKYELLNALVSIGLNHKNEVLNRLSILDLSEDDL